ncbi:MAG: hypothetical protein ACRECO_06070 [Xanthobacteraceae bacterium]
MNAPIRDMRRTDLPWPLTVVTGVTAGVLAAMVALIVLGQGGIELAGVWSEFISAKAPQLRSAGAWWLMAASAFVIGAVVAGALSRLPWPWVRFRTPRWLAGALLVAGLAHVGHSAALTSTGGVGIHVAASFAALFAAAVLALFGAYFATRR